MFDSVLNRVQSESDILLVKIALGLFIAKGIICCGWLIYNYLKKNISPIKNALPVLIIASSLYNVPKIAANLQYAQFIYDKKNLSTGSVSIHELAEKLATDQEGGCDGIFVGSNTNAKPQIYSNDGPEMQSTCGFSYSKARTDRVKSYPYRILQKDDQSIFQVLVGDWPSQTVLSTQAKRDEKENIWLWPL